MKPSRPRQLRRDATDAERRLWLALRDRRLQGVKFRRQEPIGPYVADFLCPEHGLVVEVDGGQHATADESRRDAFIEAEGFRILRFWNNEVLGNLEGVLTRIVEAVGSPSPPSPPPSPPSPAARERGEREFHGESNGAPRLRLFVPDDLVEGAAIGAGEAQAHYLVAVMRAGDGSAVALFNGRDGEWLGRLERRGKRGAGFAVERRLRPQAAEPGPVLLFALLKRQATDLVVRAATELGAAAIRPVLTDRTVADRVNRGRLVAIAIEAAEQSERLTVPEVAEPVPLAVALADWPADLPLLACLERAGAPPVAAAAAGLAAGAGLLVGPEGGFTAAEAAMIGRHPAVRAAGLGPLILRAETAALAGLAVLRTHASVNG